MDWPKLFRDTKGMRVRTTRALQNGFMTIPAGAEGVITGGHKWDAMHFQADPCKCCGVQMRISGCAKYAFEPVAPSPGA